MKPIPHHDRPELRLLNAIMRRKLLIAVFAIVCAAAAYAGTFLQSRVYSVETSMMFRFAREYFPRNAVDEGWLGDQIRIELGDAIHTELAVLGSRSVMKDALDKLGGVDAWENARTEPGQLASSLAALREDLPALLPDAVSPTGMPRVLKGELPANGAATARELRILNEIRDAMSIRRIEGTSIARIEFRHGDPAFAAAFLNHLTDSYLESRRDLFGHPPIRTLERQSEEVNSQLAASQAALSTFMVRNGIFDIDGQRVRLLDYRSTLYSRLAPMEAEPRIAEIQAEIEKTEEWLNRLTEAEAELAPLQREVERVRAAAEQVDRLLRHHRLSAALGAASDHTIRVIDPAVAEARLVGLSPMIQTILGALLGLMLGVLKAAYDARGHGGADPTPEGRAWTPPTTVPTPTLVPVSDLPPGEAAAGPRRDREAWHGER
jgi:uncharacterized protein involved in exopolysaccharide biosynthesis